MKYLWLLIFTATAFIANAQNAQEKFGKNRIQHKDFEWKYYSSVNFDVYYYQGGQELALEAIKYLESQFERITDVVGYHPYSKAKVLIYNSTADLEQSNIGLNNNPFALGGETEFLKPLIEVAFPGTLSGFKAKLAEALSSLLINEMMFGGSLKDMFQSAMLMNLPEWFMRGATKYVAEGWSMEMDDYMRQLLEKRKININRFYGKEAALAGQSIWNFISEKYGRSNISNILNYTRIIRNEEKSIEVTLGMSFERVLEEWKNYYRKINENVDKNYISPDDSLKIKQPEKFNLTSVKLSPGGTRLAYILNERGRYSIIIRELSSGKEFQAMEGGYKRYDQEVNYKMPLISWADENTLGVITQQDDEITFWLYDVYTKSRLPRALRKVDQVVAFDFNTNGRLAILSAFSGGQNDLFLISTRRDRIRRLFTDTFDDIDPVFMPNSNVIVFSSNRPTDSLQIKDITLEETSQNFNIFAYHLDTTKNILKRLTNTLSADVQPIAFSEDIIYYLSDQKGISNLFRVNTITGIYKQLTNFNVSIIDYDLDVEKRIFTAIIPELGENKLYLDFNFDIYKEIFTPSTPRIQLNQVREFQKKKIERSPEGKSFKEIINERLAQQEMANKLDSAANVGSDSTSQDTLLIEPDSIVINEPDSITLNLSDTAAVDPTVNNILSDSLTIEIPDTINIDSLEQGTESAEIINTDNYQFEEDAIETVPRPSQIIDRYRRRAKNVEINGPFTYETRFSVDYLVTTFLFDQLRGFNVVLEAEMTDMMENHKFKGRIMTTPNLIDGGEVDVQYHYLKEVVDLHTGFERETLLWRRGVLHHYKKNVFEIGASYPLNVKTRVSISPFIANTIYEDLGGPRSPLNTRPALSKEYTGIRSEFVYDNSLTTGLNIISGTRGKISFDHWKGLDDKNFTFSNIQVDIRNYQRLYKEIILATRGFYGRFFGNSPKKYAIGGMDNWIFMQENTEGVDNPFASSEIEKSDLLFLEFTTPLRGFDYASLYGSNALAFNFELRVPIIRALHNGPISSNFLRNLQFIGFYDIGSAWTGKSPFNSGNTISAKEVREGNFIIDIKNYRNPWLSSYGAGMRTVIFGYYMKFDLAWPIEDYTVGDPRFLITLGYDF